jgi:hypothetical protein
MAVCGSQAGCIVSGAVDAKTGRQAAEGPFQTHVGVGESCLGVQARQICNY